MVSDFSVRDLSSNLNDQIANAARSVGKSSVRQKIFAAVYRGQKQQKTIQEIMKSTKLSQGHVLTEGAKMVGIAFDKVPGAYKKRKGFGHRHKEILGLAINKKKLESFPTKVTPRVGSTKLKLTFPPPATVRAKFISIDHIDSFLKVKGVRPKRSGPIAEKRIKEGFLKIIGQGGKFKDWGGEKSDLYSTRIFVRGKRLPLAIAFKGKGTKGKLVPGKMGKNGDQVNRLFDEPAAVFLIVYCGQIDSSILGQMEAMAIVEALKGKEVFYGVVDEDDLGRLMAAYPKEFSK